MPKVTCYFDVASPYCWFAFEKLINTFPSTSLNLVPVHAASIMTSIGHKMPYYEKYLRDYAFHDSQIQGRLQGLDLKIPDNAFEKLSNTGTFAAQRFLAAVKSVDRPRFEDAARATWKRLWIQNKDVHTEQDFVEIANEFNISSEVLNSLPDDKWTAAVTKNNNTAIESKCFGVPWIAVTAKNGHDAVFFGSDRLPFVFKFLESNSN